MKTKQSASATAGNGGKSTKTNATAGIKLSSDYRDVDFEYWPRPTELELAGLAAQLARSEKIDSRQLVETAWALYWESCRTIQKDYRKVQEYFEHESEDWVPDEVFDGVGPVLPPTPKKYPVTFQEMELMLLPKLSGRTAERAVVFREYFFASLMGWNCPGLSKNPTSSYWNCPGPELDQTRNKESIKNEVARIFAKWRKTVFDAQAYSAFATKFLRWYREWNAIRKSEVKAINALKGWEKRRERMQARTGARPNRAALRQVLDPTEPLDRSRFLKKP